MALMGQSARERLLQLLVESEMRRGQRRSQTAELPTERADFVTPRLPDIRWDTGQPVRERPTVGRPNLQFEVVTEEREPQIQPPATAQFPPAMMPQAVSPPPMAVPQRVDIPMTPQVATPQVSTPDMSQLSPTPVPEKPDFWKQIGKGIGEAFSWLQENLEEPWAEFVTTPLRAGETYDTWKKKHKLVAGITEFSMPLWWVPYFGWAAKGASIIPKVGGSIAKGILATERALALPVTLPLKGATKAVTKIIELPRMQDLKAKMFQPDRWRTLGERMAKVPGARQVMKLANPSVAVAANTAHEIKIVYGGFQELAENAINANMTRLTSLHRNPMKLFDIDDLGKLRKITKKDKSSTNWWDLFATKKEHPQFRSYQAQMSPEQKRYAKIFGELIDETVGYANKVGVNITRAELVDGFRYIPRIWEKRQVLGVLDAKTGIFRPTGTFKDPSLWILPSEHKMLPSVSGDKLTDALVALRGAGTVGGRKIGARDKILQLASGKIQTKPGRGRAFFQQPRTYDFAEEALEAGLRPGKFVDPYIVMERYQRGIYKLIVDKEMIKQVKPLGNTILKMIDKSLIDEVAAAGKSVKQLKGATAKMASVIREDVHPNTLAALRKALPPKLLTRFDTHYPLARDYIKGLQTDLRAGSVGGRIIEKSTSHYRKLAGVAKDLEGLVEKEAKRLTSAKRNKSIAMKTARGSLEMRRLKAVGHPFAANQFFPNEVADVLNDMLRDKAMPVFTKLSDVNALSRFMVTGFDFGAGLIQGVPLLMSNPVKWGKAWGLSFQTFLKPEVRGRYLQQPENLKVLQELIPEGLIIGNSEFMQAVSSGILASNPVRAIDRLNILQRFSSSFNAFGDIARVEWAKALLPMVKREGKSLRELSAFLNEATGVMSTKALGVSATQRSIEGSVLLFAPRYFRANIAFWADMTRGGLRGNLARDALTSMIMGTFFWYYGVSKALGQEPNLDPTSGKFLTIQIGEDHIGLGSMQVAMLRLFGNTYKTLTENPMGMVKLDSRDNPLLRFYRGRVAPLTGSAWDILTGKTFLGEPLDTPVNTAKHAFLERLIPFWANGMIMDYPKSGSLAASAEAFGARTWPLQLWEKRDDLREKLAQDTFGLPWYSTDGAKRITGLQRKQIEEEHPQLLAITEEAYADKLRRGGIDEEVWHSYKKERERASQERDDVIKAAQEMYDSGEISGYEFKEKIQEVSSNLRNVYAHIENNPMYADIIEKWNEPWTAEQMQGTPLEDIAFDAYMASLYSPDMYDAIGERRYDEADRRNDVFVAQYGQDMLDYVKDRLSVGKETPPLMQEYYKATEVLKPYWEVKGTADRYFGVADSSVKRAFIKRQRDMLKRVNPLIARYIALFYTQ